MIFRLFLRFESWKSRGASRTLFASHAAYLETMKCHCSMGNSCSPLQRESGLYRCFWKELNTERNLFISYVLILLRRRSFFIMDAFFYSKHFLVYIRTISVLVFVLKTLRTTVVNMFLKCFSLYSIYMRNYSVNIGKVFVMYDKYWAIHSFLMPDGVVVLFVHPSMLFL